MPGTPVQLSLAAISPVSVQAWANGSVCGVPSARTRTAAATISATRSMAANDAANTRFAGPP